MLGAGAACTRLSPTSSRPLSDEAPRPGLSFDTSLVAPAIRPTRQRRKVCTCPFNDVCMSLSHIRKARGTTSHTLGDSLRVYSRNGGTRRISVAPPFILALQQSFATHSKAWSRTGISRMTARIDDSAIKPRATLTPKTIAQHLVATSTFPPDRHSFTDLR